MVGGVLGCCIARWGVRGLVGLAPPGLPRVAEIAFDLRILVIVSAVSAASGILFGLAPAVGLARTNLVEILKSRAQHRGSSRSRSQGAVVIAEVSICFVLLVGAGLLVQSLMRLGAVDPGFDPNNLLAVEMSLPGRGYEGPQILSLYQQMFSDLNSLPGVTAVTAASAAPFEDLRVVSAITINGKPAVIETRSITPNYFDVVGGRTIEGRTFTAKEISDNLPVVIVNKSMARQFWPNESAVNKPIEYLKDKATIVGVSDDVRQLGLAVSPPPMYYVPMSADMDFTVLIRTRGNPLSVAPAVRGRIRSIDKNIAINGIEPMKDLIRASFSEQRYRTLLITIFALSAVCLALVGLYGVMSRYVAYHNRELGIRLAIGADPRSVLALILRQGLTLTVSGIFLGWLGALGLTRVLSNYLFGISPLDTATYAGVAVLLTAVSLVAAYAPARRASRIDPVRCLRAE
jgi:predicted permease